MGDDLGGMILAMPGCDLGNVISEVRLSERREEKGENSPAGRGKRQRFSSACGVEHCLPLVGVWGGAEEFGESDRVECVRSEEFRKCVEGKMTPAIVLRV